MSALPSTSDVVIIHGGVVECSIVFHLAKLGITEVVLVERKQLTCGTTRLWYNHRARTGTAILGCRHPTRRSGQR